MTKFEREVADVEAEFGGVVGVVATPLQGEQDKALRYNDGETFPAASTIKVFVLQTLLEQVQAGDLTLEDEIILTEAEKVTGSGVLKTLTAGRPYPIKDLATLMIIVSDNTATNLLLERLSVDKVNAVCQRRGWRDTVLTGKLQHGDAPSMTSPRNLADYFARLWRGELLGAELTDAAKHIYQQQQYTDQLGRSIGYDAYSTEVGESSLRIASKSGSIRGVRNDAGVISSDGMAYAVSVMTKGSSDGRFHANNAGSLAIASVSRAVYEHFTGVA